MLTIQLSHTRLEKVEVILTMKIVIHLGEMGHILARYCMNIAVCTHFNMIHIGQLEKANMEIILKWVQTAILTIISNLLYVFALQGYIQHIYLFLKYIVSVVNMLQNVQDLIHLLANSHQCPISAETSPQSNLWCHNRSLWWCHIQFQGMPYFKGCHILSCILDDYWASISWNLMKIGS